MKIELFISSAFAPCREAERVWRAVMHERDVDFAVVDINSAAGQVRAEQLAIKLIPALVVNGKLRAIGVQTHEEARNLLVASGGEIET